MPDRRTIKIATCAVFAMFITLNFAFADNVKPAPKHATPRSSKCICGYGESGYTGLTCVPVKDCDWERGVCRGVC